MTEEELIFAYNLIGDTQQAVRRDILNLKEQVVELQLRKAKLKAEYAHNNAPYKIGDRVQCSMQERVESSSFFNPKFHMVEMELEVASVITRLTEGKFRRFLYKFHKIKNSGEVSKLYYGGGDTFDQEVIVSKA